MKGLVIDDEIHCRNVIRKMVEAYCPEIKSFEEANSVATGIEKIQSFQPDIVFLDIQLDDQTGFDLLEQLGTINFQIIFTTAFDNFALKAFEYAAMHYLLKPVIPSDLIEAVKRCANNELAYGKKDVEKVKGFYLKTHENAYDLIYDEIMYVQADGSYSTIYNADGKNIYTSKKLSAYDDLLSADFFRIHNSIIVNLNFVKKLDKQGINIILKNEKKLPLSRRKKTAFKEAFCQF